MNESAPSIAFDERGHCNYCRDFEEKLRRQGPKIGTQSAQALIERIQRERGRADYDCVVGVSGGVDSSYALYLAVRAGLRPLAVHLDNGWNSELAVHNIHQLISSLGVDLHTHVIDWNENKDLQRSFF